VAGDTGRSAVRKSIINQKEVSIMKICNKPMLVLILLFTTWIPSLHSATIDEYVGRWEGEVSVVSPNESESVNLTIFLTENDGTISGTVSDNETVSPQPFEGNISNGVLNFQFPNMSPGNPDCSNWNVSATAPLNLESNIMHLSASGIICSQGGGEPGSFSGDLIKQKFSLTPILSILLKDKDSDWFFSGSDVFMDNTWFGSVKIDRAGKLLNGTLATTSGVTSLLTNGQFTTSSSSEVTASFTTSDSTVEALSMQVNTSENFMAGVGNTVGEDKNGLFVFVKKDDAAQYTYLSDQWFLAYSDLIANRTCGGTISFTGLSGLESFRIPNGTMECTDGTSHAISGGTLNAFFVNDPFYTTGPGNVSGTFMEPDNQGRETFLQLELNVHEKIMVGYGKGTNDSENGLYLFIKKTTGASITDLAGDWFVSLADLWNNRTFKGSFHFDNSGEFVSGSVASNDGTTMTFTAGSFSVDSSGLVTGTLMDAQSGNEFVMQLSERKDLIIGPLFATSDHDNGLLIMVKK